MYTDEQAREVKARPIDEVLEHFRQLADQQRPAVERAIWNLTGWAPVAVAQEQNLGENAEEAAPAAE